MRYVAMVIVLVAVGVALGSGNRGKNVPLEALSELPVPAINEKYGFNLNQFSVHEDLIEPNKFLADLLLPHHVSYLQISKLAAAAKEVFDVRGLRSGKAFTVLNKDTSTCADYFIYEPSVLGYVVFDIKNAKVERIDKEVERVQMTASGTIESSLWQTMIDLDLNYELAARLEDALAWSVDFHHIQKGDHFKAYYDRLFIDGQAVGVGELYAAYFHNSGNDHYAIKYNSGEYDGFFDLEGRPMEKVFLKAPLKKTRISSRFNPRRFHPVLKRVKAHLGTDYAAPYGTPILAVANGVVTKASRTKGNGNYVKIKHDKVYQTQYLHMQRFAKGIAPGVQVKQGQTIGYVGSTGLATGPHVCFRFWKNGKQVNHLRLNLPQPDPMDEADLPDYFLTRDSIKLVLDGISTEPGAKPLTQQVAP